MKQKVVVPLLGGVSALMGIGLAAGGQDKKATEVQVTGHVYETAQLEPTEERLSEVRLPPGFRLYRFAELQNPRMIAVAEDGTVYVTQRKPGPLRVLLNNLPDAGQHPNRTLAFGPDGMLYLSIGSTTNAADERNPENATLVRLKPDGSGRKIYASGLRNTIGFAWHPVSKQLYGMDHGIDWLGDNDQKEELNAIIENGRYGWPFVYADGKIIAHPKPPPEFTPQDWARMSKNPDLLYTAHSAPMQMAFYTGTQFPAEYRNDAFVAMRGSWNRKPPSGYEVVRIRFDEAGKPTAIEPFLTGFLIKGGGPEGKDGHIGRLAGLAVLRDGSLLVSDDTNNILYRIAYEGGARPAAAQNRPRIMTADWRKISSQMMAATTSTTLTLRSDAFEPGQAIPDWHSDYGEGVSPALRWSGVPSGAKSLVLMMEDPDALSPRPFVHWLAANIPPETPGLPAALPLREKLAQIGGMVQGANHTSKMGYYGPRPPAGDPPHHYHFQIFALDTRLALKPGFNRQALLDAMEGHILAKGEMVGTYQRR